MRKSSLAFSIIICIAIVCGVVHRSKTKPTSPNKEIELVTIADKYLVRYNNQNVLNIARLGVEGCSNKLNFRFCRTITDSYIMLSGKRSACENSCNEYVAALNQNADVILRIYNNGIAFRYHFRNLKNQKAPTEQTAFEITEGTRRWMQQWCESYEGFFPFSTTAKQTPVPSFSGINKSADGFNCRWAYPALFEPIDDVFVLLSEADVKSNNSASSLWNNTNLELFDVVCDKNDLLIDGDFTTPWRIAIIGNLADIVESTLVTDLSEPSKIDDESWIKPGVVSWIYWAYNHGSNDFDVIKKYVDLAVNLKLPYVLIDAEWDEMKNGKTIEDAINYAKINNIKPLIWYNSSIGWIDGAPGPKFRLNTPENREKEFSWCEKMGIAGVKIDFFSGDNQQNMSYCIELLECAARHHLLVNFHGATIPRGWQRTYPNLLSTEAVYGAEWYNNVPTFTDKAAQHNATLPFTRNVIGSMDYTPCAFSNSQHPHITTNAHELALTVLFESGLQHIADRPESLLNQPPMVQDFFGTLPTAWDETRFVAGYPGKYVVIARRKGDVWYIAGINGKDEELSTPINLDFITNVSDIQAFQDAKDKESWEIENLSQLPQKIDFKPRGGALFVAK